ncbi:MAG: enoyl-CoA hydratase/isomerase family protein [Pseudomonadota bacterium]
MIRLEKDGDLWTATIDRPDKANSLTRQMLNDLADIAEGAHVTKALILTGTGKVFSAGMDLEAAKEGLATDPVWERLSNALAAHSGLTICALNGTLAGGAMGMALACDIRICVPTAKFFYPVMKLGFLPQPSDPARLAALVGPARAKLILMGGQKVTAQDALAMGLVEQIVESDVLTETARGFAADVLGAQTAHIKGIKDLIT